MRAELDAGRHPWGQTRVLRSGWREAIAALAVRRGLVALEATAGGGASERAEANQSATEADGVAVGATSSPGEER